MPAIELMAWDSSLLGARAGRVHGDYPPSAVEMAAYDMLLARLPLEADEALPAYQASGFQMVAMDMTLSAEALSFNNEPTASQPRMHWLAHQVPDFAIQGFRIDDSRLMRDARCRKRLPPDFWDRMVHEHCSEYADAVLCAVDADHQRLLGFTSCFLREDTFELFTVAVHPEHQGEGIGRAMLRQCAERAAELGLKIGTQVLASNIGALNFYLNHGFRPVAGEYVLHRWKNGTD